MTGEKNKFWNGNMPLTPAPFPRWREEERRGQKRREEEEGRGASSAVTDRWSCARGSREDWRRCRASSRSPWTACSPPATSGCRRKQNTKCTGVPGGYVSVRLSISPSARFCLPVRPLSVRLSACPSIHPSIHTSACSTVSVHPSIFTRLSLSMSVYLRPSVRLSLSHTAIHRFLTNSVRPSVRRSVGPPIHPSVSPSPVAPFACLISLTYISVRPSVHPRRLPCFISLTCRCLSVRVDLQTCHRWLDSSATKSVSGLTAIRLNHSNQHLFHSSNANPSSQLWIHCLPFALVF